MKNSNPIYGIIVLIAFLILFTNLSAEFVFDIEGGKVFNQYNDIQEPRDGGTRLSLTDDLQAESPYYYRIEAQYIHNDKHTIRLLFAPLTINSSGTLKKDINFNKKIFKAGEKTDAEYTFNSYRASYRYRIFESAATRLGIGLTGKIRDASITLKNSSTQSTTSNIGFVPLINYSLGYKAFKLIELVTEGDFLVGPGGRAEDLFFGTYYYVSDNAHVKTGYRVLEGGADGDSVYTFALFHYIVAGVIIKF